MTDKPNFLYIITDQQRSDWLGCAGHPVVKTPNIDALAARGTMFTDFHVATPVCMPNRASLFTGRMPSVHGLRNNGCWLPNGAATFVDVLAADGYDTALIGKSHLRPFSNMPAMHAPDPDAEPARLVEEARAPDGDDYETDRPHNFAGSTRTEVDTPYYGFTHVDMVTRHGDRCGGHYEQWLRARADVDALWDDAGELPHNYTCPQAYRTQVPEALYNTTWITDRAIDYVTDAARAEAPFFAFVSFPDPHHPFNPPGKYWDMYAPDEFDLPLPYEAHQNPPPHLAWLDENHRTGGAQATKQTATRMEPQHCREAMALTAGMITMIDDQIGRLIDALKASGQYENTVIIFNSDHGDYMGDFGLMFKGALPFRAITQVPMIWSDPADRAGRQTAALASTIDIAATILDRVGLTPYRGMQGQSFLGSVRTGAAHREDMLIEFNDSSPKYGFPTPARVRALRSADWRLTIYGGQDWGELYDLNADPDECVNLWDSPAHQDVKGALALRLADHLTGQTDESPRAAWVA